MPAPMRPDTTVARHAAETLLGQLKRVLAHEPGARLGDDPEELHRMRVASRRLRSAQRIFRKALRAAGTGELIEEANTRLRELAGALGRVRDLDVAAAALRRDAEEAPAGDRAGVEQLVETRLRQRDCARHELMGVLDGPTLAWLAGPYRARLEALPAGGESIEKHAPELAAQALRRLRKRGRGRRFATTADLHELRLAAKRLRYTCELLPSPPRETIALATELQDALGAINDDEVAIAQLLGDLARGTGEPAAVARLIEKRRARRDEQLAVVRALWTKLPRPGKIRRQIREAA